MMAQDPPPTLNRSAGGSTARSFLRRQATPLTAGGICFVWALAAWLTVIPNQDMLADAIQVQSLFQEPRVVLAFPGQKHAGPVEYPLQLLMEWLAPGNYYWHVAPRLVLAFLTGFVTAQLFKTVYPSARSWAFLLAVAFGPAVIHGLAGPPENPVGVWWLVGNYASSWLLVTAGALALSRTASGRQPRWWKYVGSGLLVGLGFFAHPNITLLILPLAVLVVLTFRVHFLALVFVVLGAGVGMVPAVVSYFINADITTWNPSHPPFVALPIYMNILGLNGVPDYLTSVLPSALGMPASQEIFSGQIQSVAAWITVAVATVVGVAGSIRAVVTRTWPGEATTLALAWCAAFAAMILFATFVDPVWFYAAGLSVLFWITVGALPSVVPGKRIGVGAAVVILISEATATVSHNWDFYSDPLGRASEKAQHLVDLGASVASLKKAGVGYVYGSYYDVIPLGYASATDLRAISTTYDRFPLTEQELGSPSLRVAVRKDTEDPWSTQGLERATEYCTVQGSDVNTPVGVFGVYECPPFVLDSGSSS